MIFALDERGWELGIQAPDNWIETFEEILDLLDGVLARGHSLAYSEEMFLKTITNNYCLFDLYEPNSPIPISRAVQERIAVTFARASRLDDMLVTDSDYEIDLGSGTEQAIVATWTAKRYLSERLHTPCISKAGSGLHDATFRAQTVPVWLVNSPLLVQQFFRWMIIQNTSSPAEFQALSQEAFVRLEFVPGSIGGIKNMAGTYTSLIEKIVHDLGFLSDRGHEIFSAPWQDAPARFGEGNVDISDENGRTKKNGLAKQQRKVRHANADLYFWWHIKVQPHQNRIHIFPDKVHAGGSIIIGIFCNHLRT